MHNRTVTSGFSFLELIVIFAILAMLGAFAVPNIFRSRQDVHRKEFMTSFENIVKDTVLRSLTDSKMHQMYIDIAHEVIQMREFDEHSIETNQHKKFKKVEDSDYVTEIPFLKRFVFRNFFINGIEEMVAGSEMQDVMFYIMPDGTSQAIIMNISDQDLEGQKKEAEFCLEINPFYARMMIHDTFQTP